MKKVYISKSKAGNPDDLMKVRHLLSQYDCEVTEFMGGDYNTKLLDAADIVILIPPDISKTNMGRGQYDEVNNSVSGIPVLAVNGIVDHRIYVVVVSRVAPSNVQDWKTNYGYYIEAGDEIELSSWFNLWGVYKKDSQYDKINNNLLLLKRRKS